MELRLEPGAGAAGVRRQAEGKLREIEAKIADLARMREALRGLTAACRSAGSASACPILDALEGGGPLEQPPIPGAPAGGDAIG